MSNRRETWWFHSTSQLAKTHTPSLGSQPRSVSSQAAWVIGKYMHLQAGTEPALLGRPTEPRETTQGLEVSLQPTGFSVYVFFSVPSLSLTLWVAPTLSLCAPVTWMSPLIQSVLRLKGLTGTSLLLQRTPTLFKRFPSHPDSWHSD